MALRPLPVPTTHAPEAFGCWSETIKLHTTTAPEFVDLTEHVKHVVARSGVDSGNVVVFSRHTTAAVTINELEPLLLEDMAAFLERLAPRAAAYRHNDFTVRTVNMTADESPNGHAHCLQLVLGASQTIPVHEGQMVLGQWQRIFLVELDHARPREVVVQALGLRRATLSSEPVPLARNGARNGTHS
jgi:secondary thiamine-phosphate synthase enzyme